MTCPAAAQQAVPDVVSRDSVIDTVALDDASTGASLKMSLQILCSLFLADSDTPPSHEIEV